MTVAYSVVKVVIQWTYSKRYLAGQDLGSLLICRVFYEPSVMLKLLVYKMHEIFLKTEVTKVDRIDLSTYLAGMSCVC